MFRISTFVSVTFISVFSALSVSAQSVQAPLPLHVFVREGCVHCAAEEAFLKDVVAKRSDISVTYHDIAIPAERVSFDRITERAHLAKATPVTFIAGTIIQGFGTADTSGKRITDAIDRHIGKPLVSFEGYLDGTEQGDIEQGDSGCDVSGSAPCTFTDSEYLVHIPFFGTVNLKNYSLPIISAILGFVDGFNPCAMWVLVTFLLVLLQLGNRRKVWQVAGLFIAAETIMYYLILNVWFTTWDFIGLDRFITPFVGLVAIGAGCFFLYEAMYSGGQCVIVSHEKRQKTHLRIRDIAMRPFTIPTIIAIIGLALSVNVIEFACSIGIPQTFTKILDMNQLSLFSRQSMMAIYILMYMIDDFVVFGLALWSTEHMHLTQKYSRYSNILGGVLMVLLGLLLIFAPGALKFA